MVGHFKVFLWTVLVVASSLETGEPEILNNNSKVTATAGKVVVLTCDVRGNPTPDVTWHFEKVSGGRPHSMKINGSTLLLGNVGSGQEGDYRCVATNKLGVKGGIIHLEVTEPLYLALEPPIVTLVPKMPDMRLKCDAHGLPKPTVSWSKLGDPGLSTLRDLHFVNEELLAFGIKDINDYIGIYVCNASNGVNSVAAYQVVAGKIMQQLGNQVQFQNISTRPLKAYSMTCPPGTTAPDGSTITTGFDLDKSICFSARQLGLIDTSSRTVTWVVRSDGKAQLVNGSLPTTFGQHLTTFPTMTPSTTQVPKLSGPEILNNNSYVTATAGTVVLLICDVRGYPPPEVTWHFEKVSGGRPHSMKINGSTLLLGNVDSEQEGDYRCVATNKLGTNEGIMHLKVTAPLTVTLVPPIVSIAPHIPVLRLKCVAEGLPKPTVSWSKLGGPDLSTFGNVHLIRGELLAFGIKDINEFIGIYVCNASNGVNSTAAYQVVAGKLQNLGNQVQFQNISTRPFKAFSITCPPGTWISDGSTVKTGFNLDKPICTSARQVGLIDNGSGTVTWIVRPDGKAQFVNGSLPSTFGHYLKLFPTTRPSTYVQSSLVSSSTAMRPTLSSATTIKPLIDSATSKALSASVSSSMTPGALSSSATSDFHLIPTPSTIPSVNPTSPLLSSESTAFMIQVQVSSSSMPLMKSSSFAPSIVSSSLIASSVPEQMSMTSSTTMTTTITTTSTMTTTTPAEPPSVFVKDRRVSVLIGHNLTLICNVTGSPMLTVTWDYDKSILFNAHARGNMLEIIYATNENTGRYVCEAENRWGLAKGAIELTVTKPLDLHLDNPVIVLVPSAGFALIKCEAGKGSKITWTKYNDDHFLDDTNIMNTGDGELIFSFDQSSLKNYTGVYICHGDNGVSKGDIIEVVPGLITQTFDNHFRFQNISEEAGTAFKATCPPGPTLPDGTTLKTGFDTHSLICESARKVGVLGSDIGSVIWYIRKDGLAEFVDEQKGLTTLS